MLEPGKPVYTPKITRMPEAKGWAQVYSDTTVPNFYSQLKVSFLPESQDPGHSNT